MSREVLDTLFKQYEVAFDKLDLKAISDHYADNFISAGPKGSITQNKEEFLNKAREAVNFYKSVGQNSARIISKRVMPICDKYDIVVVRWGVTFEKTGTKPVEFDVTYIVRETDVDPKIILFISHEDEEVAIRKHGLQPIVRSEAHQDT